MYRVLKESMSTRKNKLQRIISVFLMILVFTTCEIGCFEDTASGKSIPRKERWGIYALDVTTEDVELIYSSPHRTSCLNLNRSGDTFAFSQRIDSDTIEDEEICTVRVDGSNFQRLTNNTVMDTYPCWSPDGLRIAFLSWPDETMDIYVMDANGSNSRKLYDSGYHDGDINWVQDKIVFTRNNQIWMMREDGTGAVQVTDPPRAGEWGEAVLPFGDYDPRLSPDSTKIIFSRLVDDKTQHGIYSIYSINPDSSGEEALVTTEYTQGLTNWSHSGDRIVYMVSAIGEKGVYDIYMVNADGENNRNITPDFPDNFTCHTPVFSPDDSFIYFVGEWWGEKASEEVSEEVSEEASGFGLLSVLLGLIVTSMILRKRSW